MASDRAALLAAYLRGAADTAFVRGTSDCCAWASDWVVLMTGHDPMARYRGRYKTARGAARLINQAGGMWQIVALGMAEAGLLRTDVPWSGDVGLVETPLGEVLAIRTGNAWACKGINEVIVMPFQTVDAWTVP